jgi:predicted nucleic-acid-binding Zn-ribbon protein
MAYSTCPKCDSHYFELKEIEPSNSRFKLNAVQCSSCGAVVGVTEYHNVGTIVARIEKIVREIARGLGIYVR